MIQVTSVEPGADYRLILAFATGERRCFDMRPYLGYPVFCRVQNPAFFALARVDYGTVTWPGEIDIAPETLYERSTPADTAGEGCGEERTASIAMGRR